MKTKFFLFILLSLFAIQGWASPVDSLETHNPGNLIHGELSGLNLSDGLNKLNGLDGISMIDQTKGAVTAEIPWKEILEFLLANIPVVFVEDVTPNVSFVGTTVGTSVTKTFKVWASNLYGLGIFEYIKIRPKFSYSNGSTIMPGSPGSFPVMHYYDAEMFTVEPEFIRTSDLRGGTEQYITVTYKPIEAGEYSVNLNVYKTSDMSNDAPEYPLITWKPTVTILNASAVERTITTDKSSISFYNASIGETRTEHFTVTGNNTTGSLNLSLSGGDKDLFDVYPKFISAERALDGADVTVHYSPTAVGSHHATVTISGDNAYPDKTVDLFGSTGNPHFTVDSTSLSFPNATVGYPESKNFTITGSYLTGPLHLNVEDSGTHGHFTIDQDKYEISAEQVAEGVQVTVYYTPTEAGNLSGRITISGGGAETKKITLNGNAQEPARIIVDKNTLEFPGVKVGESEPKTFRVTGSNLTGDLTLTKDESDGNQFTIDKEKITAAEAANGVNVTITYTPTEEGSHSGRVLISGGGADSKSVSLSGSAQEPPRITVEPNSLTYPNKTVGKPYTQTFKVKGTNLTGDLTLTKDESDGEQFTYDKKTITAAQAKNGVNVTVTYKPTDAGTHSGCISVTGGGADSKSVSLSGSAKERIITTSATSLNFGKVAKGKSKTKKFTVKGTNLTGPLTLEATGTNKSLFTISPSTITAAQAANGVEVSVTYKPTAKGYHTAIITISGGDALSDKTVDLSGQCVEPKITVSKETLDFGNMDAGTSKTLSFTVTGTDLTGDISLTVASTDSHADFTITPTTLGANASGATVKVTCTANVAGSISGRVTVSGGDATSKTVSLTGTVKCYITTNHNSLSYSPSSLNKSVKITCVGANSKLSLAIIGDDASYFTLGSSSISMADARDGKTVSIACVPKTKTSLSAKIKITGGGADDAKYVTLSYTKGSSGGTTQICSVEPDGDNEGGNNEFINGGSLEVIGASTTDVNELTLSAKVYADGQTIIIESPVLQSAVISDIAGHAWAVDLQNGRNEIPVNASGIYIVRIREKTTKLMLK